MSALVSEKSNEEWLIARKVLYDDKTELDFELPMEYRFKSIDGKNEFNVNIFNQKQVPQKMVDLFSPLACYDHDKIEMVEFNITSADAFDSKNEDES